MARRSELIARRSEQIAQGIENIPTTAYYFGGVGAVLASGLLYLFGRRNAGSFVGMWGPTLLMLGLFNKLLTPSKEMRQMQEQIEELRRKAAA